MDKQLLAALNKTSDAIEALAEALSSKEKSTSGTATALKSGDFGAQLKSINASLKSIKKDTQEILKQNKTIVGMSQKPTGVKEGEAGKKDDIMGKMPTDNKKLDGLKKGLGIVLLLAVAVLAIGLAFKIVGKVDVLSVIGLAIGITIVSVAFEKIAKLKLSIADAFRTSIVLVMIAGAITVSSWIMKLIIPISFTKMITAILIAAMFVVISMKMREILLAAVLFGKFNIKPKVLRDTMVGISMAITASSWILQLVLPITFAQALTGILISIMFAIVSYNMEKMALSVLIFKKFNIKPKELVKTMLGIAGAITASSWILKLIMPLSAGQMITGIAISVMFFAIAFNLEKIATGVIAFKKTKVKPEALIKTLVGVATAITVSSWILKLIAPIGGMQFLTALGIAILFALISYVMPELALGVYIVEKKLGKNKMFLIPVLFTAISLAIALSAAIFSKMPDLSFKTLGIAILAGIALAILAIVFVPAIWLLAWLGVKKVAKAATAIVILAGAIAASSLLISKGAYEKYPGWKWSLFTAIALLAYGIVGWVLAKIGKIKDYVIGALAIVVMAGAIWVASKILNKGDYEKYPSAKWILGTAGSILAFGLLAVVFGLIAMSGVGALAILAGAAVIVAIAGLIWGVSKIFNKGEYEKYPSMKWNLSVIASIGAFAILAAVLGLQVLNPFFWAGFLPILAIAKLIVETSNVLSQGKYDLKGFVGWALSTVLLFSTFAPLILILGAVAAASAALGFFTGINPFEMGKAAFISIAETIVEVSYILKKGTYSGGPTYEWAKGISIALGAFAPIYRMLVADGVMKAFGMGGIGPEDFRKAIRTVSEGIVEAAQFFAQNDAAFKNGPPISWAIGVGRAIGAFAPVFKVLQEGKGWFGDSGPEDVQNMKTAIKVICEGIVEAAKFFAENTSPFEEGKYPSPKWGQGVGSAIKAFAPVFSVLSTMSWYQNAEDQIQAMKKGIVLVSEAIVQAGENFKATTPDMWDQTKVPTKEWSSGVSRAIKAFSEVFKHMNEQSGLFTGGDEVVNNLALGIRVIASSIADAGFSLSKYGPNNFKVFPSPLWAINIKLTVSQYLGIFDMLKTKDVEPKDLRIISDVAASMSNTAFILARSKRFFDMKIDPNFMKNLRSNVMDYLGLAMELTRRKAEIADITGEGNPIDKIARSMTVLASGYDKLAAALERYARATAMVLAVEGMAKGGKKGKPGLKTEKGSPSGPSGFSKGEEEESTNKMPGVVQKRKLSPLETDIKEIIKHLEKMTKEDKNKPGLLAKLISATIDTNMSMMTLIDEVEDGFRKQNKEKT